MRLESWDGSFENFLFGKKVRDRNRAATEYMYMY